MANLKFNDFSNISVEIIIKEIKRAVSRADKFLKTQKTTRKLMSIAFILLLILETFFPLGGIVESVVGRFICVASGAVIFTLGFIATCYIFMDATTPKNNNHK